MPTNCIGKGNGLLQSGKVSCVGWMGGGIYMHVDSCDGTHHSFGAKVEIFGTGPSIWELVTKWQEPVKFLVDNFRSAVHRKGNMCIPIAQYTSLHLETLLKGSAALE
jgi:hypothetical protein